MVYRIRRAEELISQVHVSVAVVGAGACGMTAALALYRFGIDCVVLERDARPSGSSALSSGFVPAPGTRVQRLKGVNDSAALFASDIQTKAHGKASVDLVEAYSQQIGPALDALQEHHGIEWQLLDGFVYPGHSALRMHAVPEKTGVGLMHRLHAALEHTQTPLLLGAHVHDLFIDEHGAIRGLGYQQSDGKLDYLRCDYCVLACNGYGGAADLVSQCIPSMRDALFAGHHGNDGAAVIWGTQAGAQLADLSACQGHGSWAVPHGILLTWAVIMQGGVQINALGQRFHDETRGYSEAAIDVLAQPQGHAWCVFDDAILLLARQFPDFIELEKSGAVRLADSIEQLASIIACDPAALEATLSKVCPGTCPHTGRQFQRALQSPYYAIKVTGALFHTQGGLDVDAQMRVLSTTGKVFPNWLAAGGAARGVSGPEISGYLSGNGLLSAIVGGHIAANTIHQLRQATTAGSNQQASTSS